MALAALGGVLGPMAPPARAATGLEVTAGYAGFHVPGESLPVQVTVRAERLVAGELVVVPKDGKQPLASLPVEVAGGSVKRFTLLVPGGYDTATATVKVELRAGGRALGKGQSEVRFDEDTELVGLGPALLKGQPAPGRADLDADAGTARFGALDNGLLAQAPASLAPLSAVGMAAGELAGLAPSARAALLRWVETGGHLLLDEPAGVPVDGLPEEWQPGPSGRGPAGGGDIRLTGDAMAAGRWDGLVEPTTISRTSDRMFWTSETVADSLAGEAGLRLPRLPWLLGFLGAYIVVVGPVTALVLRRRGRPDLAWVVVPALAVVFTGLAYVGGSQLRPGTGLAHGSIIETGASGPVATSWVALTRRNAGTAEVDLPRGWAVEGTPSGSGRFTGLGTPGVGPGTEGQEARLPLASGEFGVFKASGPAAVEGRLEVTATAAADGQVTGTVRNTTPFDLEEVVVFSGTARATVGRLAAGASAKWTTAGGGVRGGFDPSGMEAWINSPEWQGGRSAVNINLWQSALDDLASSEGTFSGALAVGWTRQWRPTVTVDGRSRPAPGRTAVVGRAPVAVADGKLSAVALRTEVVRGPSFSPFAAKFGANVPGVGDPSVVKLTLPEGVATAGKTLALRTNLPLSGVAVWHDGAWRHLDADFGDNVGAAIRFKRQLVVGGAAVIDVPAIAPPVRPVAPGDADQAVDYPLVEGAGADGALFFQLTVDFTNFTGESELTLVEVAS